MPTFIENGQNGRPAVRFDNSATPGNHLTLGGNYLFNMGSGITILAVCRSDTVSGGSQWEYIFDIGFLANNGYGFSYRCFGARYYVATSFGGVDTTYTISLAKSSSDFVIVCFRIEYGTDQRIFIDGAIAQSDPITTGQLTAAEIDESPTRMLSSGPVTIGGMSKTQLEAVRFFNGDIAEIIYYDVALGDPDRIAIEDYLTKKWGL